MARITPGNRLYLYQLFSREVGVGKQTILSRMEEVLAADDIWPCDLECANVREVLEVLSEFVRLSVFKKGRVYATVLPMPEWDELLARANEEAEKDAAPKGKGGPKSWKRKRTAKTARPAKPRPKNRPKPGEPQEEKDAAHEKAIGAVVVEATVEQAGASTNAALDDCTVGALSEVDAVVEGSDASKADAGEPVVKAVDKDTAAAAEELAKEKPAEAAVTAEAEADAHANEADKPAEAPAGELDAGSLAADVAPEAATSAPTPHATPSITLTVTYDPYEGLDEEFFSAHNEGEVEAAPKSHGASLSESAQTKLTGEAEFAEAADAVGEKAKPTAEPEPQPEPTLEPAVPAPPSILPCHFAAEVVCRNSVLSALYQILPFDVDPIALLDEDWRIARSTQAYTLEGGSASFPLRYLHESGGAPIRVHMRRKPRTVSGKRWEVVAVGEPGMAVDQIGFDGLPTEDAGAWSDLVAGAQVARDFATPAHVLALFARLGSWDGLLASLAELTAPEDWGEDRAVLREYLTLTFYRVMQQDRLATAPDLSWAAFDTGLLTSDGANIYMRFCAGGRDDPWVFESFGTEVGEPVPKPASYVETLDDITFAPPYTVRTSTILSRTYGDALAPAVDLVLRRARRSYRVGTPAYDPRADRLRLLLPIEVGEKPGALVLAPQPNGGYLATAILALDRARACARVVSAELPSWLG